MLKLFFKGELERFGGHLDVRMKTSQQEYIIDPRVESRGV